jgi:hypothetical protein
VDTTGLQRRERAQRRGAHVDAPFRGQLDEAQREGQLATSETLADRIGRHAHARLDAGRTRDDERLAAPILVDRGEQEAGNAREVIGVEVRDRDGVDGVARNAEFGESCWWWAHSQQQTAAQILTKSAPGAARRAEGVAGRRR